MFEIHRRHTPMFVTSEIKQIAQIITSTLEFDDLLFQDIGVEILPVFQTVRINENNPFIIKSELGIEKVRQLINENQILKKLRLVSANPIPLIENIVKKMIEQLGVDSYLCIGEQRELCGVEKLLNKVTKTSNKPLVIFNSINQLQYQFEESKLYDMDHPAIWLGNSLNDNMKDTESFFAMSPMLKIEVELNRLQTIESFGDFSVGMVKL